MSIIYTLGQAGTGTAFIPWMNFVNWAVQAGPESWCRFSDLSLAEHLGTCLTLITTYCTDFTGPKCSVEIQPLTQVLPQLPALQAVANERQQQLKRLWPSDCLSCPCGGDYSSARQVNKWLLKHIKLNSNWRQNTPSWKAEHSRSCFMRCVLVSAVEEG